MLFRLRSSQHAVRYSNVNISIGASTALKLPILGHSAQQELSDWPLELVNW